jgi:hypothetical protein
MGTGRGSQGEEVWILDASDPALRPTLITSRSSFVIEGGKALQIDPRSNFLACEGN